MRRLILPIVFAAMSPLSVHAATVSLDTGLPAPFAHGDLLSTFNFGGGLSGSVTVVNGITTNQQQVGEARVFDTTLTGTHDDDLEGPFSDPFFVPANPGDTEVLREMGRAIIVQERPGVADGIPDDEVRGGTITFTFDNAIDLDLITFLDGEEGADVFVDGARVGGYDAGLVTDNEYIDVSIAGAKEIFSFDVRINGSGAIGGFDLQLAPIPVPASLPLLAFGLGGLVALRRRKRAA